MNLVSCSIRFKSDVIICYIPAITPVALSLSLDDIDFIVQTLNLSCNIGDVTKAVVVSWKDPFDQDITDGVGGYTVTQGSVSSNVQESTLTITPSTLKSLDTSSPLTWKCAARSSQYSNSEQSEFQNVVVTILIFGEFFSLLDKSSREPVKHFFSASL